MSNRIGRWAPRTQVVEMFYNQGAGLDAANTYAGLSVLTDRIELGSGRVAITPLYGSDTDPASVTGGYILKIDTKDEDEYGFVTDHGIPEDVDAMVVVSYPKDADLAPAQRVYIRGYIQAMENTLLAESASGWASRTYLDYIDRPSWVDHHILNTLAANPDAFRRSAYFAKDRNGRLMAGPLWDFDRAFNSTDPRNMGPEGWRGLEDGSWSVWNIGWWRSLARDPEFMQDWVDRWQSLRRTEFSDPNLVALIDAIAATVGREAAARDAARWPDNASRFGDLDGEINALKTWLARRVDWIDRQFVAAPVVEAQGDVVRVTPAVGAQLAYTLDGSDPRSLGGDVAPNALMADEAIVVPANVNLHARSFDATRRGRFPGTPWSSAVDGADSTPLRPAARVVNISTLGGVGAADDALVARFPVANSDAKRILARAVGPGLAAFGMTGVVQDPRLALRNDSGLVVAENSGWDAGGGGAAMVQLFRTVGAFPLAGGSGDAAIATTLRRGSHELRVTSVTGRPGVALAELYELDANGSGFDVTLQGFVRAGSTDLVAGFVVQGPACSRLLFRASGPTLADHGIVNPLRAFQLVLYRGSSLLMENEGWTRASNATQIANACRALGVGVEAGSREDAAILTTLAPGAYTASVRGIDGAEGVALLAIQTVP